MKKSQFKGMEKMRTKIAWKLIVLAGFVSFTGIAFSTEMDVMTLNSPGQVNSSWYRPVADISSGDYVMLADVPTSEWTYGCSATSAGMIFGYYDRTGYDNMYTGSYNGGVAPLHDLGAKTGLIASKKGLDGRTTYGHVDDYWVGNGEKGPDPWVNRGVEHNWGDCVADCLGTNQWKWDYNWDGQTDSNSDGGTSLWSYHSAQKLYDYVPPVDNGSPSTSLCHGLRVFAESRGYEVLENFTQKVDSEYSGGFSFEDFMYEIDSGRPVMVQLFGHSIVGVGYDELSGDILIHDTWDNEIHYMDWGGSYADMDMAAVTVLRLAEVPEPSTAILLGIAGIPFVLFERRWFRV